MVDARQYMDPRGEVRKIKASYATSMKFSELLGAKQTQAFSGVQLGALVDVLKAVTGSTSELKAGNYECQQVAGITGIDQVVVRKAFDGRSCRQLIEVTKWILKNADDPDFHPATALHDWTVRTEANEEMKRVKEATPV